MNRRIELTRAQQEAVKKYNDACKAMYEVGVRIIEADTDWCFAVNGNHIASIDYSEDNEFEGEHETIKIQDLVCVINPIDERLQLAHDTIEVEYK